MAKNEQHAAVFGRDTVVGAASKVSGELLSPEGAGLPGSVLLTMAGETVVGEWGGGTSARVDALASSGLAATASGAIDSVEWSKLVVWSGAVVAAVARLPLARCFSDPGAARLAARVIRESGAVAARLGVGLQDDPPLPAQTMVTGTEDDATDIVLALGQTLGQAAPDMRPSILQDADRGQRLEVDETLGHTLKLAAEHGVQAPTLDMCFTVLAAVSSAATPASTWHSVGQGLGSADAAYLFGDADDDGCWTARCAFVADVWRASVVGWRRVTVDEIKICRY